MICAKKYETVSKFVKVMPRILWPLFSGHGVVMEKNYNLHGGSKSKPDYYCNNFVYCQPTFIIFGTFILYKTCKLAHLTWFL